MWVTNVDVYIKDIKRKDMDVLRGVKRIVGFLRTDLGENESIMDLCSSVEALELLGKKTTGYVDDRLVKGCPETARKDLVSFGRLIQFLIMENEKNNLVDQKKLNMCHQLLKNIVKSLKDDQKR